MSFASDIDKAYDKKVYGLMDKVTRKVVLDVQSDLSKATPVDTGRARSNWLPSVGLPNSTTTTSTNGSPMPSFAGYKVGMSLFISNNLPYISRLNEGWSKQAPAMFVEKAVQKAVNRIKEAVRAIKI